MVRLPRGVWEEHYNERGNKMLLENRRLKLVDNLMNVSGLEFSLYEERLGNVVGFEPCCSTRTLLDAIREPDDRTIYAVMPDKPEIMEELGVDKRYIEVLTKSGAIVSREGTIIVTSAFMEKSGVGPERIAVVSDVGIGHGGAPIATLAWAENPRMRVGYVVKAA